MRNVLIGAGATLALAGLAWIGLGGSLFNAQAMEPKMAEKGKAPTGEFDKAGWPQWRGANRDGIITFGKWAPEKLIDAKPLWQKDLGVGASSMSISHGRLYTVGNMNDNDIVYCLDAITGKELWRFEYPCKLSARQFEGGPAATPTVDGDRVYQLSHEGHLFCLHARTGELIWRRFLMRGDLNGDRPRWGFATSPLVEGDLVIVDVGGSGQSTVAFNKMTGETVWKAGDDAISYGSAIAFDHGKERLIGTMLATGFVARNVRTGAEAFRFPWKTAYDVNASTPIVQGSMGFVCSGYGTGAAVFDFSGRQVRQVWVNKEIRPQMASAILFNGHLYGVDEGQRHRDGLLKCVDWKTGQTRWSQAGFGQANIILVDDKLIILSDRGELTIAEANPKEFKEIARAQVLSRRCWVAPAFAGGLLYVRNNDGNLVCIDLRK